MPQGPPWTTARTLDKEEEVTKKSDGIGLYRKAIKEAFKVLKDDGALNAEDRAAQYLKLAAEIRLGIADELLEG